MAISLKHTKVSAKSDGPDSTLVQATDWNAEHALTATGPNKVVGRMTSGSGAVEELQYREVLTANRTYYVAASGGSDSNDGSSGSPFATINKAVAVASSLDANRYQIIIQLNDGTHSVTSTVFIGENTVGLLDMWGALTIQGNASTPTNVVVSASNCTAFEVGGGGVWFKNFRVQTTTSGNGILVSTRGGAYLSNIYFGDVAGGGAHLWVSDDAYCYVDGTYTVAGSAAYHLIADGGGTIVYNPSSVTFTGTPAFTYWFVYANNGGIVRSPYTTSFSGSITGTRWGTNNGGVIADIISHLNYWPGSAKGYPLDSQLDINPLGTELTLYVRTDGNDNNSGAVNTSAGAFLTIQAAYDYAARYAGNTAWYWVKIKLGNSGTWTAGLNAWHPGLNIWLEGDTTTPANTIISTTSSPCVYANMRCRIDVVAVELRTTTAGDCLIAGSTGSFIGITDVRFGACAGNHMIVYKGANIVAYSNYTISGGALRHVIATQNSFIEVFNKTVTLTGTPAFTVAFADAIDGGYIIFAGVTISGSATGTRYSSINNSHIQTNGGGATYLPGDVAGSTSNGGIYT